MYQDSPDYQLFFRALANLYPDTPLAQDIAGTVSSLSQIDEKVIGYSIISTNHPICS